MKNAKLLTIIGLALLVANLCLSGWNASTAPKVAYVRSSDLVYGYFGMKEAMSKFEMEQKGRQGELDTLSADLQNAITLARQFASQNDEAEFNRMNAVVVKKRNDLMKHSQTVEQRSAEEEQKILGGVLSQVNAFVEEYAKSKGYDIILGTTANGSLLYGKNAMDITDDVLVALNHHHEGL